MEWKNKIIIKKVWLPILAGCFLFILLDVLLLEKIFFKINRFKIGNRQTGKRIKIIQISDLHFKKSFNWKYKRLLSKIKSIDPDLLIVTGDALDRNGQLSPLQKFLASIPESIKKVAILGNHDYLNNTANADLLHTYKAHGVDYLVNETKNYDFDGCNLTITGLDDFTEGADHFEKAFANVNAEKNHIILAHNPKHIDRLEPFLSRLNKLDKNLVKPQIFLSGHTHGGQIKLKSYTPGLPVSSGRYVDGWYKTKFGNLYINKGIGTSTVPVRLGARSEVTIFDYFPQ